MKPISRFICILTLVGVLSARGQEPPDAKGAMKEIIANAKIANAKAYEGNDEFRALSKKEEAEGPLTPKEEKRLKQIRSDRATSLKLNRQVADLLKVGASVFSYPGLLGLSQVEFDELRGAYSLRLTVDYRGFEGGIPRHPTFRIVRFDDGGRITGIEEFATVKMVKD